METVTQRTHVPATGRIGLALAVFAICSVVGSARRRPREGVARQGVVGKTGRAKEE